jgi:hypothetical protein
MDEDRIPEIEQRISVIKAALQKIGPMRPGSLTRQYRNPKEGSGAFWQLSYTRNMKSRSEYVRKEMVKEVRKEIAAYRRFKTLIDEWVDLSIERSQARIRLAKTRGAG